MGEWRIREPSPHAYLTDGLTYPCYPIYQPSSNMSKRTVFTTLTALPAGITRESVIDALYDHVGMIDLNPLVEERHPIKPPATASAEEYHCKWYSLTDKVQYLPGGMYSGRVTYSACFHDLPTGIQTHIFAPLGLNIKGKWTVGGSLPGEPIEAVELGLGAPKVGLWLREDVDMKCNVLLTGFVKKNLKKAHEVLVGRLLVKAHLIEAETYSGSSADRRSIASSNRAISPETQSLRSFTSPRASYHDIDSNANPSFQRTSPSYQVANSYEQTNRPSYRHSSESDYDPPYPDGPESYDRKVRVPQDQHPYYENAPQPDLHMGGKLQYHSPKVSQITHAVELPAYGDQDGRGNFQAAELPTHPNPATKPRLQQIVRSPYPQ